MTKVVAQNRRARFDYEVTDTVEAGVVLTGAEAKSCRLGHVDLSGAFVSFFRGKAMLKNTKITHYRFASNSGEYRPDRDRELLLSAREREKLQSAAESKGLSVIPLEVRAGKFIKILLGVARGRKTIDKRRVLKERDIEKKLRRGDEI